MRSIVKPLQLLQIWSQPLGKAIGNRLEITEAIEIMQGKGREDITDFICELAGDSIRFSSG